jgi:hypothetical protein
MKKYKGRREPYTELGLKRVPCARCDKKPSRYQWSSCANNNYWVGVCEDCDILLNEVVLAFFGFLNREELMNAYLEKIGREPRSVPPQIVKAMNKPVMGSRPWKSTPDRGA